MVWTPYDKRRAVRRLAVLAVALACSSLGAAVATAQSAKEINDQVQFWGSINATPRFSQRWGAVADFHVRRNNFLEDPSFYLVRFGAHYWLTETLTLTAGYAREWVAPAEPGWKTWTKEDRIYQQFQNASQLGSVRLLHRLRNEQRWQQAVENDVLTGDERFSDRVRYLVSVTVPVSGRPSIPALVVSDEILVQFGTAIVNNTFDQNRLFAGIKQRLSTAWSFDAGYMLVYRQKASGYQYDRNHAVRLFFYYNPAFRQTKPGHDPAGTED